MPIFLLLLVAVVLGAVGIARVYRDTQRREGRWGINTSPVTCPRCHAMAPQVRAPKNVRQALWGGWTCTCGCELDKWGREIPAKLPKARIRD